MRRRWRVRVDEEDGGRRVVVYLSKGWLPPMFGHLSGLRVATLDLTRDDAEQQLAEARARAQSYARSITQLEAVSL